MTLHFGKRNPGSLTAADPGDTLYIPFSTINDSGASIVDTGFNHADVEIYKNNNPVARATDSGVWLGDSGVNYYVAGTRVAASALSDTGLFGDVKGLYTIGIRLFNTTDDTGFYDAGSTYHVTVQGLSIKSGQGHAEVNFIPAVFEIDGRRTEGGAGIQAGSVGPGLQADIRAVVGDTGAAHLDQGRFGVLSDSGVAAAVLDTGKVAAAVWTSHATRTLTAFAFDTGIWGSNAARTLTSFGFDTGIWGSNAARTLTSFAFDTGIWGSNVARTLTSFAHDTGVADTVWKYSARALTSFAFDTGIWGSNAGRTLTSFALDTGVADTVWKYSTSGATADTGSTGYAQGRLMAVKGDTGAAHLDAGRLGVSATTTVDTGQINNAVWVKVAGTDGAGSIGAYLDTGISESVWKYSTSGATGDTGATGYAQGRLMAVKGDTGAAHVSAGRLGVDVASLSDTGILDRLAELDTGVAGIVRNLLDAAEIDGLKVIEAMRLWTSVLGGVVNGAGSGTEVFSEINDTGVARVTATVTAAGNRTAITLALDT